jgi:hypothetical protein
MGNKIDRCGGKKGLSRYQVWTERIEKKKGKYKVFLAVASLILIFAKLAVVRCATDRRSRYNSV